MFSPKDLGFDSHCWSCVEVLDKLFSPYFRSSQLCSVNIDEGHKLSVLLKQYLFDINQPEYKYYMMIILIAYTTFSFTDRFIRIICI